MHILRATRHRVSYGELDPAAAREAAAAERVIRQANRPPAQEILPRCAARRFERRRPCLFSDDVCVWVHPTRRRCRMMRLLALANPCGRRVFPKLQEHPPIPEIPEIPEIWECSGELARKSRLQLRWIDLRFSRHFSRFSLAGDWKSCARAVRVRWVEWGKFWEILRIRRS